MATPYPAAWADVERLTRDQHPKPQPNTAYLVRFPVGRRLVRLSDRDNASPRVGRLARLHGAQYGIVWSRLTRNGDLVDDGIQHIGTKTEAESYALGCAVASP